MTKIHPLPTKLVSKIAAGEVVERPASVVKELLENALDAGATEISIEIKEGGARLIKISDNGAGMEKDDLLISFKPHTTSKITTEQDLEKIATFGFRGEALSSIASVSRLIIKSRPKKALSGMHIEVFENILEHSRPIGMPYGTEISVESLFITVPARKKFLKDARTEFVHIANIVTEYALAFPSVGFKLSHDGKNILNVPGNQKLSLRIKNILGDKIFTNLVPLSGASSYGKIEGYVGKPQLASRIKSHQYLFINSRSVTDQKIAQTISKSFGNLLEAKALPVFILYLKVPYESVDVNIHPRKEEVAFAYPDAIRELVQNSIQKAFVKNKLTYNKNSSEREYSINESEFTMHDSGMDPHLATLLKNEAKIWQFKPTETTDVSQFNNLYLITKNETGIVIIDQHAAHERILFEQFTEIFEKKSKKRELFILKKPLLFELPIIDSLNLENNISTFQEIGFDIESFGKNTFKLSTVPLIFKARDYTQIISSVLQDLKENNKVEVDRDTEKTLAYLACRSAIKAGDSLSLIERKDLISKLLKCKNPYTCPHGRPTHIEFSLTQLHKMFKRI
jgi:DNA mismatch repair protein MutL